jgi:hypothetical protein
MCDVINAGDIDGFGELLGDDFVEHEVSRGISPTQEGAMDSFRMFTRPSPVDQV